MQQHPPPPPPPPYVYPDQSEQLPAYSNSIHLVTLCRRKREYTAPNVPARKGTRSWNFTWLVLSGTALNVYQPKRSEVNEHTKREADIRAARLKEHKRAAKARKTTSAASEPRSTASPPAARESPAPAPSSEPPPPPALAIGGKPHRAHAAGPDAHTHTLVRRYALTGATCVRAYDYLRRYFVLRIRAEGEQFMVQLNSHPETLEWLAAFSVAACLCLDLDERPMVEPPVYPRSRRHPSDSSTGDQLENSDARRVDMLDSSEAAQLFLTRYTTIRINV